MNILGIGPAELVIVVLIMLVVAGPKRMIQWAYIAGRYWAKIRAQLQEANKIFQKELEQAGLDPEVVNAARKITTQGVRGVKNPINEVVNTFTKPIAEAMKDVGTVSLEPKKVYSPRSVPPPASPLPTPTTPTTPTTAEDAAPDDSSGPYDAWTPN